MYNFPSKADMGPPDARTVVMTDDLGVTRADQLPLENQHDGRSSISQPRSRAPGPANQQVKNWVEDWKDVGKVILPSGQPSRGGGHGGGVGHSSGSNARQNMPAEEPARVQNMLGQGAAGRDSDNSGPAQPETQTNTYSPRQSHTEEDLMSFSSDSQPPNVHDDPPEFTWTSKVMYAFDEGVRVPGRLVWSSKEANTPRSLRIDQVFSGNQSATKFLQVFTKDITVVVVSVGVLKMGPFPAQHKWLYVHFSAPHNAQAFIRVVTGSLQKLAASESQIPGSQMPSTTHSSTAPSRTDAGLANDSSESMEFFNQTGIARTCALGLEELHNGKFLELLFFRFDRSAMRLDSPVEVILDNKDIINGATQLVNDYIGSTNGWLKKPEGFTEVSATFGKQVLNCVLQERAIKTYFKLINGFEALSITTMAKAETASSAASNGGRESDDIQPQPTSSAPKSHGVRPQPVAKADVPEDHPAGFLSSNKKESQLLGTTDKNLGKPESVRGGTKNVSWVQTEGFLKPTGNIGSSKYSANTTSTFPTKATMADTGAGRTPKSSYDVPNSQGSNATTPSAHRPNSTAQNDASTSTPNRQPLAMGQPNTTLGSSSLTHEDKMAVARQLQWERDHPEKPRKKYGGKNSRKRM